MAAILALVLFAAAVVAALGAVLLVAPRKETIEAMPDDVRRAFDKVENWALGAAFVGCLFAAIAGWVVA